MQICKFIIEYSIIFVGQFLKDYKDDTGCIEFWNV